MSKYAAMSSSELGTAIRSMLEPRVLLAEDAYSHALTQSRTALAVWRGVDALERVGAGGPKLEALKENLEIALHDEDEAMLTSVREEVTRELEARNIVLPDASNKAMGVGLPELDATRLGPAGRPNFDPAPPGPSSSVPEDTTSGGAAALSSLPRAQSVKRDQEDETKNDPSLLGTQDQHGVHAPGTKPDLPSGAGRPAVLTRTVPLWKRPFVLSKDKDGRISTFEKAWCISIAAWGLAILGCIIVITIITVVFVDAQSNKSIQIDRERMQEMALPRLTWCHIEDNVPAFFEQMDPKYKGSPLMGVSFWKNLQNGSKASFPESRNLFKEVIVANGTESEQDACKERLRRFKVGNFNETSQRGNENPTCRVCIQPRQRFELQDPQRNGNSRSTSSASMSFIMATSRLLTMCMRSEGRQGYAVTIAAAYRELAKHFDELQTRDILNITEAPQNSRGEDGGVPKLFEVGLEESDETGTRKNEFDFLCNIFFFSGVFYPNSGEDQRWKYVNTTSETAEPGEPETGRIDPIGEGPYFETSGIESSQDIRRQLSAANDLLPKMPTPTPSPGASPRPQRRRPPPPEFKLLASPLPNLETLPEPYTPYMNVYAEVVEEESEEESSEKVPFRANSSDVLSRISAEGTVFLRIQREDDQSGQGRFRAGRVSSLETSSILLTPESNVSGYFQYSLDLSFEAFLRETVIERSTYSTSQYIADVLNMLGIFLGVSIFAVLVVPATSLLIRSRSRRS